MRLFWNEELVSDHNNTAERYDTKRIKLVLVTMLPVFLFLFTGPLFAEQSGTAQISLTDALEAALKINPRIGAAGMEVRQAEAAVREAQSSLLPDLVTIGDYTRYEEPALVTPMHGSPTPANPLEFDRDIYTGVLRLDVPILDLASLASVGASRRMVDAGRAQARTVEQEVMAGVIELYVQMGQLSDTLTLLDSHIAALTRRYEELMTLAREGRVPEASVAEVAASLDSGRSDRLELVYRQEAVAYRLGELLGRNEAVYPRVHDFSVTAIDKESLTNEVVTGPQGLAADAKYAAAREAQQAALYSFVPRLSGFASQTLRAAPDTDISSEWALGLSVSLPILTGGERAARLQSAEARMNAARYARDVARAGEQNEARIAQAHSINAALRREYLAEAVRNKAVSVRGANNRYTEGRTSLSDLLTEEAELLELRMRERSMLYEELLAYVAYYKITGELSPSLVQIFIEE